MDEFQDTSYLQLNLIQKKSFKKLAVIAEKTENKWDDAILLSISKPLSIIIWAVSIALAAEVIEKVSKATIFEDIDPLRNIIVIIALAQFLIAVVRNIETFYLSNLKNIDSTTLDAIIKLSTASIMILAAMMILQTMGFSISGILAFGGIGGLAVGFAAQDLLSNFFGGFILYFDRPFAIGDWIRSPDREIEGTVIKIGWRITTILTFDKRPLYIPNSLFSQISVENPSRMSNRRIKETIGLRYGDASKVETIIKKSKRNAAKPSRHRQRKNPDRKFQYLCSLFFRFLYIYFYQNNKLDRISRCQTRCFTKDY